MEAKESAACAAGKGRPWTPLCGAELHKGIEPAEASSLGYLTQWAIARLSTASRRERSHDRIDFARCRIDGLLGGGIHILKWARFLAVGLIAMLEMQTRAWSGAICLPFQENMR